MTEAQEKFLERVNSSYDKNRVEEAFLAGASVEQVQKLWDMSASIINFRPAICALAEGFDMSYAEYLARPDLKYNGDIILRSFKKGVTLEQAKAYFSGKDESSQIEGRSELLINTTEEKAAPYLKQPFRLRQYECIVYGFKNGYTEEQIALYAKPEIKTRTMQIACKLIDNHTDNKTIQLITEQPFSNEQLDVLAEAAMDKVPASIIKLCAKRNSLPSKMRAIIQGYKEGFTEIQLFQLADAKNYEVGEVFERTKAENREKKPVCAAESYESLKSSLTEMAGSLTGAQKKELVDILLFGIMQ